MGDMWIIGNISAPMSGEDEFELMEKTQLSLLLQMGMICHAQAAHAYGDHRHSGLRLVHCLPAEEGQHAIGTSTQEEVLRRWLRWARIPGADVKVVTSTKCPQQLDA